MSRLLLAALLLPVSTLCQDYYTAALDAAQEVPANNSAATGWAVIRVDPVSNQVRIFAHHQNLTGNVNIAHLHQGAVGVNGPIVFGLAITGPNTVSGTAAVTPAQVALIAAGDTYINIHTTTFGGGEIRGQVVPANTTRFTGLLEGSQEVPPVTTTSTGSFEAYLLEPDNRLVYYVETAIGGPINASHLHRGAPGVNGGIVHALNGLTAATGDYCGVSDRLDAADVALLLAGDTYFNVHTPSFPGGELRGQVLPVDSFVAEISGGAEVPPTPSAGEGGARCVFNPDGTVTVDGRFAALTGTASVAHVHVAPPGANGPIVFALAIAGNGFSGTHTLLPGQLADLQAGNWYVNVHSTAFPGGELRGQLEPAQLPTSFGGGCTGSNGIAPVCITKPFASVGSSLDIDCVGSFPGTFAFLAFSLNRDTFGGVVPLPIELTLAGINAPGCFVLVDPTVTLGLVAGNDGCTRQTLNMPPDNGLRGDQYFCQWFLLDPLANPGSLVSTNAAEFTIQ